MTDLFRGPYELKIDSHKFDFIFPKKTDNLRITDIALYSMILSVYSKYMVRLLKNIYFNYSIDMKDLNIFDLGSNIGGTLYYFLREIPYEILSLASYLAQMFLIIPILPDLTYLKILQVAQLGELIF